MKGVVARALALRFALPQLVTFQEVFALVGGAHFDKGRRAAHERGAAARRVGVFGVGAHEGEVDVNVRVDEAGEDELA